MVSEDEKIQAQSWSYEAKCLFIFSTLLEKFTNTVVKKESSLALHIIPSVSHDICTAQSESRMAIYSHYSSTLVSDDRQLSAQGM